MLVTAIAIPASNIPALTHARLHLHRPYSPFVAAPEQPGDAAGGGLFVVEEVAAAFVDFVAGEVARHAADGFGCQRAAGDEFAGAGDADFGAAASETFTPFEPLRGIARDRLGWREVDFVGHAAK